MTSATAPATTSGKDLDKETLVEAMRLMYSARKADDREIMMKRQNKVFFQISGAGHECPQVAASMHLKAGYDWFFPYYRDRALCLGLGMTLLEMFQSSVGAEADPASAGRQMPSHWGHKDLNIVSTSSPTGTQFLQSVGCAEASLYIHDRQEELSGLQAHEDEVTLVCTGDGTTSQGEFWEALNTACNLKAPVIFLVEDNGYAISVPVEAQTAGGSISALVKDWPNLLHLEVDGCDFAACYDTFAKATAHCRERKGPALVHAHVIRPYSHSMSDDELAYKTKEEQEREAERDPIKQLSERLVKEKFLTQKELDSLKTQWAKAVDDAAEEAESYPQPEKERVFDNVYSEVDPTSEEFSRPAEFSGDPTTMVDLINLALKDQMGRDLRIRVFGEDVADATRESVLEHCKGKGGVFKATHGLQTMHGSDRCFNSPLAEANIVGRAIGMAVRGLKPVVEIQFFDYIWPAFHQLRNELATMRWRSGGAFKAPVVVRVPIGGYLRGGGPYHSQSGEVLFTHTPGVRVVFPSNAEDANGLLRTAMTCDDPVMFLEHKHLYRQTHNKGRNPGADYSIPFGQARVVREGNDLTVVTYGALVHRSDQAAKMIAKESGATVEILDLRTLSPYDWNAIAASVKKTSKVIVAHEDCLSWGYGAEIASRIADELFEWLDGPVRRIGATDTFVGYAPRLEEATLPNADSIAEEIRRLLQY